MLIIRMQDAPSVLYKYRFFDPECHHLQMIKRAELYFTSARKFNDPFDANFPYTFEDEPPGIRFEWTQKFLKDQFPHLNDKQRKDLAVQRLQEIDKDPDYYDWFKNYLEESNYQKFGFCSLTAIKDDLLMWAHYSDNHQGFCVGIDTRKLSKLANVLARNEILLDMAKVEYSETMPEINFFSSMISDYYNQDMMTLLCTKSKHWSYEQEFRLIYWDHVNTNLTIGHDVISEIILGCRIPDQNRKMVLSILSDKKCPARVYQAHKHKRRFELVLEQIR